jgi:uncharacterized protein (DUF1697 family)
MIKYVAFLRAINVGGRKVIKMETLRGVFESLGLSNVVTYLQSGNVAFDSRIKNQESLKSKVEKGLKESLGHEVTVVLLSHSDLAAIVKRDPFNGIKSSKDVMLFVAFFTSQPTSSPKLPFALPKENLEVIAAQDRAVCIVARRKENGWFGFPNNFIEKQFGVSGTTRNWNTVKRIVEALKTDTD